MRADDLRALLDRRPFRPLRLHVTGGQHVDILHPEMAILSKSVVAVVVGDPRRRIGDEIAWYNLVHIVKITEANGHRRRSSRR